MKKLLLILMLFLCIKSDAQEIAVDCTTDVYLPRMPIINGTHITGTLEHRELVTPSSCGVLGPDDLRITCNPLTGVRLSDDQSNLFIPDYFEVALINPCTGEEVWDGYKEEFYLVSGNPFPYYVYSTGDTINVIDAGHFNYDTLEWDSLIMYGIPPKNLANRNVMCCVDPYDDCAVGVTAGRSDTYPTNYYYLDPDINGVYLMEVAINLPATVYDPGVYPNDFFTYVNISGLDIDLNVPAPTYGTPYPVTAVSATDRLIQWTSSGACAYKIQRKVWWGKYKDWTMWKDSGAPIIVTDDGTSVQSYLDTQAPTREQYVWVVYSMNGVQSSNGVPSNKQMIK